RDNHEPVPNSSEPYRYYQTTYGYDTSQRLLSRVAPTGLTTTWTYTAGGNAGSYTVVATDSPVARTETRIVSVLPGTPYRKSS
ncbi:MAG: hypothetical protein AAB385_10335, partial [Planctomycetota bacterium]